MARPLIWFTGALVLFLIIGFALSNSRQRALLLEHASGEMDREFSYLRTDILKDIEKQDYEKIRRYLIVFANRNPGISAISVVSSEGSVLADYSRPDPAIRTLIRSYIIGQNKPVRIDITHDLLELHIDHLASLTWQNISASLFFSFAMAGFLWSILRRTAFIPLETALRELGRVNASLEHRVTARTIDLMRVNTDLQSEITERQAAELALVIERDFTNAILNTVGAIVLVLDRDGRIIRFNRACEQVSGYTFEEARGRLFWEFLLAPEQVEPVRAVFDMLSEGKFPSSYENYWITKSGTKRMISWSNTCMNDTTGNVSHVIATGIDITEKRCAAEELDRSQAMQRLVIENISEMIYLVSLSKEGLHKGMSFVGGRVVDILGYSTEDFVREPLFWFSLVHPEDLPGLTHSTRNLMRFRTEVTLIYRVRHRSRQEYLWLEDKIVPQFNDLNEVVGYFGVARDITPRKMAEDKLRKALVRAEEEKNKSDAIIAAIGDGISIQDLNFKILYQNIHLRELAGEHVGEYCFRAYRGKEEVCPDCAIAHSFADGNVHVREHTVVSEKAPLFVEITASPLRDASGHIIAGLELVRNITDRKRSEVKLKQSYETQFVINTLMRISLDTKTMKDVLREGLDIVLSSSWCASGSKGAICLAAMDGCLAMTAHCGLEDSVPGGCIRMKGEASLCRNAVETGLIQFAIEKGDIGCDRTLADRHYRVPIGPAGSCLGVLSLCLNNGHHFDPQHDRDFFSAVAGALRGLIERKHLEEEREQMISDLQSLLNKVSASRLEWQETFDSITDMISILDEDSRIIKANKAFAGRFGLAPRDVILKKCHELFQGQVSAIECPDVKMLDQTSPITLETADPYTGKIFLVSTFPFYSAESKTRGTVRIARDITQAKENEMRLIMSERLAALGQMASGVAHEINNPLAAIAGCVDGMSRRISRGEFDHELFRKYLTIMKEELTRSKNITTTMLSVVQKKDYEKKQMNIHDALNKSLEIIGYQGRLKNVDVQKNLDAAMPNILGSEGELKQVFLIILGNALDAMHDRGVLAITTRAERTSLLVDISDSGPGIPSDNFSRIFDPFFTTKSDRGGTGLGLSIANRIITAHNGCIRVTSGDSDGKGAIFSIELPFR